MRAREPRSLVRGLGVIATISLVAGNIVGSGVFVMPAALAKQAGPLSLLAWPIVALAYLCLAKIYTDLASIYPITGGMQAYVQRAFGDVAGLVAAFMYWVSCVIGNAAFITAFVGYFQVFVPAVDTPLECFLVAQTVLWGVTLVNILGVRAGGAVQTVTVVLKVVPLLALAAVMLLNADTANLHPFAPHGGGALFPAISMVAWLFLGAESVTVPAEEIKNVAATIRRSAFIGFGLATVVYMAVATGLTLAIPSAELIDNPSPLAYAATKLLGPWGGALISAAALISILGVLNGWLLVTGRIPYSAARMGVAPAFLGVLHARTGTPVVALIFSSALTAVLALSYFSQTILDAYTRISLAATNTALVTVGLTCAAYVVLSRREAGVFSARQRKLALVYSLVGVAVVLLLMAGSGRLELIGTAVCIVLPLPFFYWVRRVRRNG